MFLFRVSRLAAVVPLSCMLAHAFASAASLRSPWDLAPPTPKTEAYTCPVLPALPPEIVANSFYSDPKHSIIDPARYAAYREASERYARLDAETARAADVFQATGSREAAACVLHLLLTQASANAMTGEMSSNQAYYVQNWTLGAISVAWLKVRSANPGTPEERKAVLAWMERIASEVKTYFAARHAKGTNDGTNNHLYWSGFAVMGTAIATNNSLLYEWGASTLDEATSRITPEGTLPLEMDRGQRALHYHLFALPPIVMMAEFEAANGVDAYSRKCRKKPEALKDRRCPRQSCL